MKRKIVTNFLICFFMELLLLITSLLSNENVVIICAVCWLILPLFSLGLNCLCRKRVQILLSAPVTTTKGETVLGQIQIKAKTIFLFPYIICDLKLQNRLTGEENIFTIATGSSKELELTSDHCGYLQLSIEKCYLMDWFGFLPLKINCEKTKKISVLPDTFVPQITLNMSSVSTMDADAWSDSRRGMDTNEIFSLREYVQGDSLKQIHWKLSVKQNQLIVKEASLPVEKSLLLFWDKNSATVTPKEMDCMAEAISSICQELSHCGIAYTLGWTNDSTPVFHEIETKDQLLQIIPQMLKSGANPASAPEIVTTLKSIQPFSKALFFSNEPTELIETFSADTTALLCTDRITNTNVPTIVFTPDNYKETLAILEL